MPQGVLYHNNKNSSRSFLGHGEGCSEYVPSLYDRQNLDQWKTFIEHCKLFQNNPCWNSSCTLVYPLRKQINWPHVQLTNTDHALIILDIDRSVLWPLVTWLNDILIKTNSARDVRKFIVGYNFLDGKPFWRCQSFTIN